MHFTTIAVVLAAGLLSVSASAVPASSSSGEWVFQSFNAAGCSTSSEVYSTERTGTFACIPLTGQEATGDYFIFIAQNNNGGITVYSDGNCQSQIHTYGSPDNCVSTFGSKIGSIAVIA